MSVADNAALMMRSWRVNAQAWIEAVRGGLIASRRVATEDAIVNAAMALQPGRVLDVGCGEGWLCRALSAAGVAVIGLDASPELIGAARQSGGGEFHLASYADLVSLRPGLGAFPVIVCNFSLLEEDVGPVLSHLRQFLEPGGSLLIQTLHPGSGGGEGNEDGWRIESFAGFEPCFTQAMPWYFRSLTSWSALLTSSGLYIESVLEPPDPKSGTPLSLLLECKLSES
jgi:2-polyprenyl-3-methyl-5-hydroxy-6-metoxy-1,4-benzoquinol methylase